MRVLTFTTLYPNAVQTRHGQFVEQRLLKLYASTDIRGVVMAPVPWFPLRARVFGRFADFARVPQRETRHGVDVLHPRWLSIPHVGQYFGPQLLARAMREPIRRLVASGQGFDVIDAHFFFPDGAAAALLADYFNKPLVITARGSDINWFRHVPAARRWIERAVARAQFNVAVSAALGTALVELGAPRESVQVLPNGVDLAHFRPLPRAATRAAVGFTGPTLLSVGNLVELKGHDIVIEALRELPEWQLVIVGSGPYAASLRAVAHRCGVDARVRFTGSLDWDRLVELYSAADFLVLASSREGMPNVVLESLACGNPVIASAVGGVPEILTSPEFGELVLERTAKGFASAVRRAAERHIDRARVRELAERFTWDATIERYAATLLAAAARYDRGAR